MTVSEVRVLIFLKVASTLLCRWGDLGYLQGTQRSSGTELCFLVEFFAHPQTAHLRSGVSGPWIAQLRRGLAVCAMLHAGKADGGAVKLHDESA